MKKLAILILCLIQIQTVFSQLITIENFSGRDIDFWNNYFKIRTDLHPLEGVYLNECRGFRKSTGHEVKYTSKKPY